MNYTLFVLPGRPTGVVAGNLCNTAVQRICILTIEVVRNVIVELTTLHLVVGAACHRSDNANDEHIYNKTFNRNYI